MRTGAIALLLLIVWVPAAHATKFEFVFKDNAQQEFAARGWMNESSLFQRNFRAAGRLLGLRIDSNETIQVLVEASNSVARAGGTYSNGRLLSTEANGINTYEAGPLSRVKTGSNPGFANSNFDMLVSINVSFLEANYWIDPEPETRTSVKPDGITDFIWIILHEMGHGLGMAGERQSTAGHAQYGMPTRGFQSVFDKMTRFLGNGLATDGQGNRNALIFEGAISKALLGTEVDVPNVDPSLPISSQNFYHLGGCTSADILRKSLMNGCSTFSEARAHITDIDLAVFKDIGYPIIRMDANFSMANPVLHLPFVDVPGLGVFDVDLTLINADTLEFELTKAEDTPMGTSTPAVFSTSTETLDLPSVEVLDGTVVTMYRIEMQMVPATDPPRFVLTSAIVL